MDRENQDTVLVVNDVPDQLALIGEVLRKAGYRTLAAEDGRRALAAASSERPALVISDVSMPVMDGIELCRRLRADAALRHTPVLLVSAHRRDTDSVVEGLAAGADDYLEVPFDPLRLVALVARLIERARAEAHYREIVEQATDIIYTTDLQGRFTSLNRACEQVCGYDCDELLGLTWDQLVAPEYAELARQKLLGKLAGEASVTFFEVEMVTKAGRRVPLEISSQLVYEGGRAAGVQGIARDITARRAAEAEHLARAERDAESEKMRSLGQLSAGVAHNFNNALTAILGRTQLLLRQVTDERQRRNLLVIETAAQDAAEIVRRVQTFARRSATAGFGRVRLSKIVSDTVQLTRTRWEDDARAAGVRYDVHFFDESGGDDQIVASSSELREVFVNLILNAVDAMPGGGQLTLRQRAEADALVVEVTDTGAGIPEELRERVFEPFFTTKGPQGSGLGLSVSYGIVRRHGGTLEVESAPGRGTTFRLRLPRRAGEDAALSSGRTPGPPALRVLVVDDEPAVREVLSDILRELKQEVTAAGSGQEALDVLAARGFDLLITDLSMPDMDGLTLAERARQLDPRLLVALATGYAQNVPPDALRPGRVDSIINKPFQFVDVESALLKLFGARAG
jgi:PAS domain S-box-containing protein